MRLDHGLVSYSPGDLRSFLTCQLDTLRQVDALLGRIPERGSNEPVDVLGERLGEVGRAHQAHLIEDYLVRYGRWQEGTPGGVLVLPTDQPPTHESAAAAMQLLTRDDAPRVVGQLPVAAGRLYGAADFLVRLGDRWQLTEVRLGLRLKEVYLLQIGALALGLLSRGVLLDADAVLVTGDRSRIDVPLVEAMDRARALITRFERAADQRLIAEGPASWDDDSIAACGWCPTCQYEMTLTRDVRMTVGLRMPDRALLRAGGVRTIDDLARASESVDGLEQERFETLRAQARLQVRQMPPGSELDPARQLDPVFEVYDDTPLAALPEPSAGDVFFDFESDPMWSEEGSDVRGLHYLFGMVVPDEQHPYVAFWAHDRDEELQALRDFVRYVQQRLARHPSMHIYHYGSYETMVLREVARRFQFAETTVEEWIEGGLFVDLLPVVKSSIRTSQPGYGLKKIEPLYMGDELRTGEVIDGAASVVGYQRFTELREGGHYGEAGTVLDAIADYNRYDCLSTLRLRDWLRSLPPIMERSAR